ncbi:MAG: L,D-transpeptidase family protein [bacterium]|nr:L,D-transpeptidase family protein [bacterium]
MKFTFVIKLFTACGIFFLMMPGTSIYGQEVMNNTFVDSDADGLTDWSELHVYHSNPMNADTDFDGYFDGHEIENGYSPINDKAYPLVWLDADKDGLNDAWEIKLGSDLMNPDTDGDGIKDGQEVTDGYSPIRADKTPVKKQIRVDIKKFQLQYFQDGALLDTILVSTGVRGYPTPRGDFKILQKKPVVHYGGPGYDLPNTKWNLKFTIYNGWGYFIHGAYWHNLFGIKNVSHGCVNVAYKDMERLYEWAQVGTPVHVQ